MERRLEGKIALVTGGAKGLGESDVRLFVKQGARVIIADVDEAAGQRLAAELGDAVRFTTLDAGAEDQWGGVIADIEREEGRLDILVNNAGIAEPCTPLDITQDLSNRVLGVSLFGTIWGCKHAIPLMARGGGGSIINMASIAAVQGLPRVAAYSAAKGGVDAYTRCVAAFCAQSQLKIRCNAVLPDRIDTPMVREMSARVTGLNADLADNAPAQPENRRGEPDDVGHLIVYLASDESKFISGQSFVVDNTSSITKGFVP